MRFLFLEPFFGGSHRDFAEGLVAHTRHEIDLLTLPARFWKWRMRGAALYFFEKIESIERYDGLITCDLMSVSDLKALLGPACPPILVYFHENQLTYPLAPGEAIDFQFGFTDITTALVADRILFNSHTHFEAFFSRLSGFINMMPEFRPKWVIEEIRKKADVLYPGCQLPGVREECSMAGINGTPPLVIWNHRWEFDKGPKDFFLALDMVLERGLDFRLALLGENFQAVPKEFIRARQRYGDRIEQYGHVESKEAYFDWLKKGEIVISTAQQENFGISTVEAVYFGCFPILPHRLSYPEIIPEQFHGDVLYKDNMELSEKIIAFVSDRCKYQKTVEELSEYMERFSWENFIKRYDEELETLACMSKRM